MKKYIFGAMFALVMFLSPTLLLVGCGEKYVVTFDSCGGSSVQSIETKEGTITKPNDPTKQWYNFDGWYIGSDYDTKFNFSVDVVSGDIALYAKWTEEEKNTLHFDSQGGTAIADQEAHISETVQRPSAPQRDGYVFDDWYVDDQFDEKFEFGSVIEEETTLYANWTPLFVVSNGEITGLGAGAEGKQDIVVPDEIDGTKITKVAANAFKDADLRSFTFGKNLTSFGESAFAGNPSLANVYYTGNISDWVKNSFENRFSSPLGNNLEETKTNLYFGENLVESVTFDESITSVAKSAFMGFTFIEGSDFVYNGTLEKYLKVQFSNRLSNPTYYAHLSLTKTELMWTIDIPSGINYIQPGAFSNLSIVHHVNLPESVKFVGEGAFADCENLQSINLEEVVHVYDSAFYNCEKLEDVDLTLAQRIYDYAFFNCKRVQTLTLGKNLSSIGDRAFTGCRLVTEIYLGTNVKTIGMDAFYDTGISEITLPWSLESIAPSAFRLCIYLKTMTIDSTDVYTQMTKPFNDVNITTYRIRKSIVDQNTSTYFTEDNFVISEYDETYYSFSKKV